MRRNVSYESEKGASARALARGLGLGASHIDDLYKSLKSSGFYWRETDKQWVRIKLQRVTVGYLAFHGDGVYTPYDPAKGLTPAAAYIEIAGVLHAIRAVQPGPVQPIQTYRVRANRSASYIRRWSDIAYIQGIEDGATFEEPQISDLYPWCIEKRVGAIYGE